MSHLPIRSILPLAACMLSLTPCLSAVAQEGPTESPLQRLVATDKEAFLLFPPALVSQPEVRHYSVSSDGRFALLERQERRLTPRIFSDVAAGKAPPPEENTLHVWDSRSHQLRQVWKAGTSGVAESYWLPGTDTALALVSQPEAGGLRAGLLRVNAATGKLEVLGVSGAAEGALLSLMTSPVQPFGILHYIPVPMAPGQPAADPTEAREALYVVRATGGITPLLTAAPGQRLGVVVWAEDATPVIAVQEGKAKAVWHRVDIRSGRTAPLEKRPPLLAADGGERGPLSLRRTLVTSRETGSTRGVPLLWLESGVASEFPRALISAESTGGRIAGRGAGVFYKAKGALWYVPLLRMGPKELQALAMQAREAERAMALNQGKQAALAVIMYASDHNNILPTPDQVPAVLDAYVKSPELFTGFTYTYGGGRLSDIASPSETIIGVVERSGIKVDVYADGHVKAR